MLVNLCIFLKQSLTRTYENMIFVYREDGLLGLMLLGFSILSRICPILYCVCIEFYHLFSKSKRYSQNNCESCGDCMRA